MEKKIQICPEELFFLGKEMGAKYIDYDYIRMMPDIQIQFPMREKEIMASLVRNGLLLEDFSGNMELDEEIEKLLKPVFFGAFESELFLTDTGKQEAPERYKFHFHQGEITQVKLDNKYLLISGGGEDGLKALKNRLLPEDYPEHEKEIPMDEMETELISHLLILKNMLIGKQAAESQFLKMAGTWYVGKEENVAQGLTREAMRQRFVRLMMGE